MYSDSWHKAGYIFESRIKVFGRVYYRHVFDSEEKVVGVIVDYEFADDFHYELLEKDWSSFCDKYLSGDDETESFRRFISGYGVETFEGKFAFENALVSSGIKYNKIAFY